MITKGKDIINYNSREGRVKIFEDTMCLCKEKKLKEAIEYSVAKTKVYGEEKKIKLDSIALEKFKKDCVITVSTCRSLEAAQRQKREQSGIKIGVLNFASATNPGGGVTKGSNAQEECLCRCSTLYPVLKQKELWKNYYEFHRKKTDTIYTDTCIYTPDIYVIKTDQNVPEQLPEEEWYKVDIISCAAPNLREKPNNYMNPGNAQNKKAEVTEEKLLEIHKKRGRKILECAIRNQIECLILGAFGCGAFCNNPQIVATAYKSILPMYRRAFQKIEFAVYCSPKDKRNFEIFQSVLSDM